MESKMKHTPELWSVVDGHYPGMIEIKGAPFPISIVTSATDLDISDFCDRTEAARRIVACVNACKHYTTEDLEDVGENLSGVFVDVRARCAELVEQLDQAVRALISGGYTLAGGAQEWKPPTGPSASPLLDRIDGLTAQRDELLAALKEADLFIKNGIELGFIKMPHKDTPDRAHKVPGIVSSAIAKCEVKS